MTICILDTSVLCNVLDIPSKNQQCREARAALRDWIAGGADLLLPLAAIYETGRHISQLSKGSLRRKTARYFVDQVRKALAGEAPWKPCPLPVPQELGDWLDRFPDAAMRGQSLADLSLIYLWETQCQLHPARRVLIWSCDRDDLAGYDRAPPGFGSGAR
jgi:hypothetical protein